MVSSSHRADRIEDARFPQQRHSDLVEGCGVELPATGLRAYVETHLPLTANLSHIEVPAHARINDVDVVGHVWNLLREIVDRLADDTLVGQRNIIVL